MGLNIVLEDERGEKIDGIIDSLGLLLGLIRKKDLTTSCCLRFVDPYGNTVFNRLQMAPLLLELTDLHNLANNQQQYELLSKVEELVNQCAREPHLYIKIYGD